MHYRLQAAGKKDDFSVTALCGREMGALIADDTGALEAATTTTTTTTDKRW